MTAVIGNIANKLAIVVTIGTRYRVWPPGEQDWWYWVTWGCWYPATVGFFEWFFTSGSAGTVTTQLRIIGGGLTLGGLSLAIVAIRGLGISETTGVKGALQTGGLYRYSRNPQYVGDIVMTVGWMAVSDSVLTAIVGVTYACYYLLLPFAVEPWLRQEYGDSFDEYRNAVPRYIGTATISRLVHDLIAPTNRSGGYD